MENSQNVTIDKVENDELLGNRELLSRQLDYLATVRMYLEQQLELCQLELERITDELNKS